MTGYGRAQRMTEDRKITVEIKSLNSKQLDLSARIPSLYREKEYEIRNLISRQLSRGKVEVSVNFETISATKSNSINVELFTNYYNELNSLATTVGYDITGEQLMSVILRMPDVMSSEGVKMTEVEASILMEAVVEAVDNINNFREQEGAVLMADLLARVEIIELLMARVLPFESERIDTVKNRLMENLQKMTIPVDNNRFEQEIIYFLEKFDITEEKVRLKQHCDYFRQVATETEGVGRKLGFIAQEMGREINTMGSKANHSEIQKIVVEMKDELEKIKEQLLNIL